MILNRWEDAVAQKCRMAFYLKPGHKVWIQNILKYHFTCITDSEVEFVGGLSNEEIMNLTFNVVR